MKEVLVKSARCMGCRQCTFACAVEHSLSRNPLQAILEDPPPSSRIEVRVGRTAGTAVPVKCRHCNPAPCETVCPSGAMARAAVLGPVLADANRCTPCLSCAKACPFGAVVYRVVRTTGGSRMAALKCDGCADRVAVGLIPACADACKTGALVFADREVVRRSRVREIVVAAAENARPAEPYVHPEQDVEHDRAGPHGGDR